MQLKHNSRTVNVELFELASCVFAICFVRTVSFAQLRVPCRSLDWRLGAFGTSFFWHFESSSGDSSNLAGLSNFGSIDQHFSKDAGNECRTNLRTWTRHQLSRNDISEALTLLITNLDREKIYLYLIRTGGCLSAVKLYFLLYFSGCHATVYESASTASYYILCIYAFVTSHDTRLPVMRLPTQTSWVQGAG